MPRRYKDKVLNTCELEKEIISKIGDNKTREKTFQGNIHISPGLVLLGFYTHRGIVCVLDSSMIDVDFSKYDSEDKKIIHNAIMNNLYN